MKRTAKGKTIPDLIEALTVKRGYQILIRDDGGAGWLVSLSRWLGSKPVAKFQETEDSVSMSTETKDQYEDKQFVRSELIDALYEAHKATKTSKKN